MTETNKRPNVLFLLSDEHGFRYVDYVSAKDGGEPVLTPNLGALADRGTAFTDAYCQMPLCTPSRISLLTGLEARRCGAWTNESVLRPELPTMPGAFREAGYATALVGKMHLGGMRQFVGFQDRPYGDLMGTCGHQWEPLARDDRASMRMRTLGAGVTDIPESLIQDEIVAHETVAYLREKRSESPDQPWFLCASFSRPHFPLTAPKRWFDRYWPNGVTPPKVPDAGDAYDHPMSVGMRKGFAADAIEADEMMKARAGYFACVSYLDEVIGDLLMRLDASGLLDDTIIVYTSDHGELAGEHGVWWKNGWYEGCTRVPLIISTPEQRRGERVSSTITTPVGLYDLFPTLCELAGVNAPNDLTGRDLSASVRQGVQPDVKPVVTDNLIPRWGEGTEFRSVRLGDYKYVRFRDSEPLFFDVVKDPGEQVDLLKHDMSVEVQSVLEEIKAFVDGSIDFDQAEKDRLERDGTLKGDHAMPIDRKSHSFTNLYHMPSGQVVAADEILYSPKVISETGEDVFGKEWHKQNGPS